MWVIRKIIKERWSSRRKNGEKGLGMCDLPRKGRSLPGRT